MAFYGESYAIISTTDIDYDSVFLHYDGLSALVGAGGSFMVLSQADSLIWDDLTAATDLVVSWVVEVGPGSAGSLSCTSGLDPTWDGTDPGYATEAAGTKTATGAATLVFPQTVITKDALLAFDAAPLARFECVTGSVDVQQVKLRVWPAGGAGGAWTTGNPYEVTRTALAKSSIGVRYVSGNHPGDPVAAWGETRAGIDGMVGDDAYWEDSQAAAGRFGVFVDTGSLSGYFGEAAFTTNIVYDRAGTVNRFSFPMDVGVDPRETRYEPTGSVRASGVAGTQAQEQWTGWTAGSKIAAGGGGSARIASEALSARPVFAPDGSAPFILPTSGQTIDSGAGIAPPAAPVFAYTVIPDNYLSFQGVAADSEQAGLTAGFSYVALVSDYEFYDPAAVPVPELSPRFFVKDLDGLMRPVGFGKPATETAVFRVPTAVGMYRDLTTAEYATYGPDSRPPGGYPLKVKRRDADGADWWDHVGWMVPVAE